MHYHLELIMPPAQDVEQAVARILKPFDENWVDDEGHRPSGQFYDWYQIGGRYTGCHDNYDPAKNINNYETCWLCNGTGFRSDEIGVTTRESNPSYTCHGCGKRNPDGTWTHGEFGAGKSFKWPTEWQRYENDIITYDKLTDDLKAYRVIIADEKEPITMIERSYWNGVNWNDTKWNGTVKAALALHRKSLQHYKPEYRKQATPTKNWLVVTIDYHS